MKYNVNKNTNQCETNCPYVTDRKIGSYGCCSICSNFISQDKTNYTVKCKEEILDEASKLGKGE